ncbi:DUF917 domain-containing protein [Planctobacterium marinum]|uniref:DUF917 domain-containing protein n=1 Tax=Planctobacterium marinum TaxID=1631968 RepID=UPI001E2C3069|nr:DUF917 domain-containing protein [Planctobacterium marinum]MCC2607159.1 DUF917 domain-containing protein [Planctobacterium marinum]
MKISVQQLDDLALGAVFLATGGGGDPYVPLQLAKQALRTYGDVTLLNPENLQDDARVITLGGVGAPTVSLELLPSLTEASATLQAWQKHTGETVDAVAAFEIGGANSLLPLIAAATSGTAIVDGDGMGRALPEAQMMSYAIEGVSPSPAVAYDYQGNVTSFSTKDTATYERHIRALTVASGGMLTTAEHPMTGKQLKRAIIPGTLSFAIQLGQLLKQHKGNAEQILPALQELFETSLYGTCRLLSCGKIIDKSTQIVGGYDLGQASIMDFSDTNREIKISIKNEYLLAREGDKVLASVPDLIVIVDYETVQPINAERLRYGQRVAVFAVACPAFFRSEKALAAVSPRCFGFDFDYVPLEEIPT